MKIKSLIAATALALSSVGAFAITLPDGSATNPYGLTPVPGPVGTPFGAIVEANQSFTDYFTFYLPPNGGVGFSVVSFGLYISSLDLTLSTASLHSNSDTFIGNGDDSQIGSVNSFSNMLTTGTTPLVATAGNYYLKVTGQTGANSGGYLGAMSVTAVPEPESFAMMLAGLGLMGSIALRRNRKNKA